MIKTLTALITAFAALSLSGCFSGDGGDGGNDSKIGQLTLTGIEGLRYQTASQSGQTNSEGEFRYYEGETISFWIGDLQIASSVPAKPFLSPIDFSESNRSLLQSATSDRFGLTTHVPVEERLAREDAMTVNITRLLLILDEDKTNRLGDGKDPRNNIKITERVKSQLNRALAAPDTAVDFDVDIDAFASETPASPINAILNQICFFPEDDRRCNPLEDQEEIDQLEAELALMAQQQEDGETIDEDRKTALTQRLQELRLKNREILDGRRTVGNRSITAVETFLVEQTRRYNSIAVRDYYVTPYEINIPASDTGIKTARVRSNRGELELTGLDAISTNESAVVVPRWDAQTQEVDFYATGTAGAESEVLISFRPAGNYRWHQVQVRPVID